MPCRHGSRLRERVEPKKGATVVVDCRMAFNCCTSPHTQSGKENTTIEVKICADTDGETCVLCRSEQRIANDSAIRVKHEQKGEPARHCGQVAVSQKLVKPKPLPEPIADMNWASLAMLLDGDTRRINSNQCAQHCGEADGSD